MLPGPVLTFVFITLAIWGIWQPTIPVFLGLGATILQVILFELSQRAARKIIQHQQNPQNKLRDTAYAFLLKNAAFYVWPFTCRKAATAFSFLTWICFAAALGVLYSAKYSLLVPLVMIFILAAAYKVRMSPVSHLRNEQERTAAEEISNYIREHGFFPMP